MNIQQLLEIAIDHKASDIHLLVNYHPMIKVHGELMPVAGTEILVENDVNSLVFSLLNPYQKHIFETNFELDFGFSYYKKARFRVNIYRSQGHNAASLRLIPTIIPDLDDLGMPAAANKIVDLRQGFILVTGPTGHGKSTTLASFINKINLTRRAHIITIEDPVEYTFPSGKSIISQREMYFDTKSWPNALRAALREDPDVVMVGEMRDLETISAAITIAETGHLVFGTLHTNSASQSIDRIIDVFPENQQPQIRLQLATTLEAIISQRLIPTILPGRVLAVELLLKTPALTSLIQESKTHLIDNLIQTSGELGMVNLETSLAALVKSGKVSIETAQNYSLNPALLMNLTRV